MFNGTSGVDPRVAEWLEKKKQTAGLGSPPELAAAPAFEPPPAAAPIAAAPAPAPTAAPKDDFDWKQGLAVALSGLGDSFNASAGRSTTGAKGTLDILQAGKKNQYETEKLNRERSASQENDNPASETSRQYQALMATMVGKKPEDLAHLSATRIAAVFPLVKEKYESDKGLEAKKYASDATERAATERNKDSDFWKSAILGFRKDDQDEKRRKAAEEIAVPGYELAPGIRARPEEATKAREALANLDAFEAGIGQMKNLVKKFGSFELTGKESGEMETLANGLQLTLKELDKLGALTGPDKGMLEAQVADPSTLRSLFTSDSTRQSELDTTLKRVRTSFEKGMTSKGYKRSGAPAPGQDKPKTVTQNGHTYTLNEQTGKYE